MPSLPSLGFYCAPIVCWTQRQSKPSANPQEPLPLVSTNLELSLTLLGFSFSPLSNGLCLYSSFWPCVPASEERRAEAGWSGPPCPNKMG